MISDDAATLTLTVKAQERLDIGYQAYLINKYRDVDIRAAELEPPPEP